jgi:hypothetical protein
MIRGREMNKKTLLWLVSMLPFIGGGCFYAPERRPTPAAKARVSVPVPYDLTWNAVHHVVESNDYRIVNENPDSGVIEAQAPGGFTLKDADCGKLKGIGAKYPAEPASDSSALYDITVEPDGNEASRIGVRATFTSSLQVPMHPMSDVRCVSLGTQESRLLREIAQQAKSERRREYEPPISPLHGRDTVK